MKLFLYSLISCLTLLSCHDKKALDPSATESINGSAGTSTGLQKEYYDNGQLKINGKLNNEGLKEGVWTSYFENGQKNSESNFRAGSNNGYSMVWYPNGNVRYFGDYASGKKIGIWTFYNENGKVSKTESF